MVAMRIKKAIVARRDFNGADVVLESTQSQELQNDFLKTAPRPS